MKRASQTQNDVNVVDKERSLLLLKRMNI